MGMVQSLLEKGAAFVMSVFFQNILSFFQSPDRCFQAMSLQQCEEFAQKLSQMHGVRIGSRDRDEIADSCVAERAAEKVILVYALTCSDLVVTARKPRRRSALYADIARLARDVCS